MNSEIYYLLQKCLYLLEETIPKESRQNQDLVIQELKGFIEKYDNPSDTIPQNFYLQSEDDIVMGEIKDFSPSEVKISIQPSLTQEKAQITLKLTENNLELTTQIKEREQITQTFLID